MSRRACVAVPPIEDFYFTPHRFSALGARIVAGMLQRAGWEVSLLLFPGLQRAGRELPLPSWLQHLKPSLLPGEQGPLAYFSRYRRFGPDIGRCAEMVLSTSPDVVFISLFAYAYADSALSLAQELKRLRPGIRIVAGGAGASVAPWRFGEPASGVDELLRGEAEVSLREWIGGVGRTIEPEVEAAVAVQSAARHASRARRATLQLTTMLTRGCPKRCSFCANHLCHGRSFRRIPAERVIAAFENLPAPIGDARVAVNFEDDNILFARTYFFDMLNRLRRLYGNPRFTAENGLDYERLDAATVQHLVELGFEQFNLSLATVDPQLLEHNHRQARPGQLKEALRAIDSFGKPAVTYFICGLPGDRRESVVENLLFMAAMPTRSGISLFYPVPGLPGFDDPDLFRHVPAGLCAGSSAHPWSGSLTTAQMVTAFRLSRLVNLIHEAKKGTLAADGRELLEEVRRRRELLTVQKSGGTTRTIRPPEIDGEMERLFFEALGSINKCVDK